MTLQEFLSRNRIETAVWEQSALTWELLQAIAADHDEHRERLRDSAEFFARVIQRFPGVHSVRWRIKETEHLMEKIVRKRADGQEKYKSIDQSNYFEIVTDLVGLRALHLFKDDCFSIDKHLRSVWSPAETPIAYVRDGDPQDLVDRFIQLGLEVKPHPAGYRSVHYVCSTQPMHRKVFSEVQVRTIFEEGWSEIDHRVRYPNFSDDKLVSYFLTIFNRLAGSADEMGTFVQGLTRALGEFDSELRHAHKEKEEALATMDKLLSELDTLKKQDADTKTMVSSLQKEVERLRRLSTVGDVLSSASRNAFSSLVGLDSSLSSHGAGVFGRVGNPLGETLKLGVLPGDAIRQAAGELSTVNSFAQILKGKK